MPPTESHGRLFGYTLRWMIVVLGVAYVLFTLAGFTVDLLTAL